MACDDDDDVVHPCVSLRLAADPGAVAVFRDSPRQDPAFGVQTRPRRKMP